MTYGKSKLTLLFSLLLAAGVTACDKPGPAEKAGKQVDQTVNDAGKMIDKTVDKADKSMTEKSKETSQVMSDAEITTKVKAAIFAEPGLSTLQISVDTVNRVVTLTGSVGSSTDSDKAKSLAAGVAGVQEVINRLSVTPGQKG